MAQLWVVWGEFYGMGIRMLGTCGWPSLVQRFGQRRQGRWLLMDRRSSAYAMAVADGSLREGRWRVSARKSMS